jgi:hypothetical protein
VLQLRLAEGLLDYPTGKSAMVHYAHTPDVRAAATVLAADHPVPPLLCRHLDLEGSSDHVDLTAFHAKVREEFIRRFGSPPAFPPR